MGVHQKGEAVRARRGPRYETACINDKLIFKLRDLNHIMRSLYEGRGSQTHILIVLLETGPVTQRELTRRLGIQPGSASEVMGKLESAGLICRTPSQRDRRTADITLTEQGRIRAQAAAAEQRSRRHEEMFALLSGEEKAALLALLERLADDWERRYQK